MKAVRVFLRIAAVGGVVAATHAWMLDYPLVLDDYSRLEEAQSFDRSDFLLGGTREPHTVFRPVLWATQRLDHAIWGWWIPGHHVSSIAWHALTCVLLAMVVRELVDERRRFLALAAALLFAVHPAKHEAVAWIAARGSLLPATFGLLAAWLQIRRRKGRAVPLALPVSALILAFLSKESAVGFAGAVLAVDVSMVKAGEGRRSRRLDACVLGALPFVMWGARRLALGEDATRYLGWYLQLDAGTLTDTLRTLPEVGLAAILGPAAREPAPWLLAPLVLCALAHPYRRGSVRALIALVVAFICVATPMAFVARVQTVGADEVRFVSRLIYPSAVPACVLLAAPLAALAHRGWRRWCAVIALALVVAWCGRSAGFRAASELEGRSPRARRLAEQVTDFAAEHPAAIIAVEDLPGWMEGIAWGNFRPPFHDEVVDLRLFRRSRTEEMRALLARGRPVALARWRGGGLDFGRVAPAAAARPCEVRPPVPSASVELPSIEPRAMPAIALDLVRAAGDGPSLFDVVLVDASHRRLVVESGRDPRFSRGGPLIVPLDDHAEILELLPIVMVAIHDRSGPAVRIAGLRTLAATPALESIAPAPGAVIGSESDDLVMRFRDPGEHPIIRLGFRLGDHVWSTTVWRATCRVHGDGTLSLRMDTPDVFRGAGGPSIGTLLDELGVERIEISWWVEGLDGQIFHPSARSEMRRLTVVR